MFLCLLCSGSCLRPTLPQALIRVMDARSKQLQAGERTGSPSSPPTLRGPAWFHSPASLCSSFKALLNCPLCQEALRELSFLFTSLTSLAPEFLFLS